MTAVTTLTVSTVRLPYIATLTSTGPAYSAPVSLGSAASFVLLASTGITNTVGREGADVCWARTACTPSCFRRSVWQGPSTLVGDIGCYPTPMSPPQPAGASITGVNYGASSSTSGAVAGASAAYSDIVSRAAASSTSIAPVMDSTRRFPGIYTCMKYCKLSSSVLTLGACLRCPRCVCVCVCDGTL